jgi:HTH-type transcriptional regulator/antitoxin HipB
MDYPVKNPQQLGQVLKGLRREKGLTQTVAGARIGLLQSEVSGLEADPGKSSVERLFKFLSALELHVFIRDRATPTRARKSRSRVEW